jgi:hypothetical protein
LAPELLKKLSEILAAYKNEKLAPKPISTLLEKPQRLAAQGEQSTSQNEGGEQAALEPSNQIDEVVR